MKLYIMENPNSALAKVYGMGISANSPYLRYYQRLESAYENPKSCEESIDKKAMSLYHEKIRSKHRNDNDSKLGTYLRINPNLQCHVPKPQTIMESERELVTRFRTGSHSLAIETGRYSNTPRENRLCSCGLDVQTVWHIFSECPLTRTIVPREYDDLKDAFEDGNLHCTLLRMAKKLKIQIW